MLILLGPYIELALFFSEDSPETEEKIMMWVMGSKMLKTMHPELEIIDLLPQNLERTMDKLGINDDSFQDLNTEADI